VGTRMKQEERTIWCILKLPTQNKQRRLNVAYATAG